MLDNNYSATAVTTNTVWRVSNTTTTTTCV
jgi:hypothetical protein